MNTPNESRIEQSVSINQTSELCNSTPSNKSETWDDIYMENRQSIVENWDKKMKKLNKEYKGYMHPEKKEISIYSEVKKITFTKCDGKNFYVDCIQHKMFDKNIYVDCAPFFQNTTKKLEDWISSIYNKKLIKELFVATKQNMYVYFKKKKYTHYILAIYITNWISPLFSLTLTINMFDISDSFNKKRKKEIDYDKIKILEKCINLVKSGSMAFDNLEKITTYLKF